MTAGGLWRGSVVGGCGGVVDGVLLPRDAAPLVLAFVEVVQEVVEKPAVLEEVPQALVQV